MENWNSFSYYHQSCYPQETAQVVAMKGRSCCQNTIGKSSKVAASFGAKAVAAAGSNSFGFDHNLEVAGSFGGVETMDGTY